MNVIPLIQGTSTQEINTSIIAIKKALSKLEGAIGIDVENQITEINEKIVALNNAINAEVIARNNAISSAISTEVSNRNTAISDAVNALDVSEIGGSGKYISAISETDGKISATASNITSTVSSGDSQPVTSGGVADAIAYDYSYYVSGEATVFVIEIPYTNNSNTTTQGQIVITAQYATSYILNFYNFINEDALSTTANLIGKLFLLSGNGSSFLQPTLKWDVDTTNKKVKFYLKKTSNNTRFVFKIVTKQLSNALISFSTTTDAIWNNASYSQNIATIVTS